MKQIYTNDEKEKLIDAIINIAMMVHESGIQTAEKLDVPNEITFGLRERSPRASMVSPCSCDDCNPSPNALRRKFLKSMMKGFVPMRE